MLLTNKFHIKFHKNQVIFLVNELKIENVEFNSKNICKTSLLLNLKKTFQYLS
jgi:hypothetical protein